MSSSFPIVPSGHQPPMRRTGDLAARQAGSAPIHRAGEMGLADDAKLRKECWDTIGQRTRQRLGELAGNTIEWYARKDSSSLDGRSHAAVFGDRGLSIAEPRINTDHRPVYAISAFEFTPSSLRHVPVDYRPRPQHVGTASGVETSNGSVIGLSTAARGMLGNLPPRVQELLQVPFATGQQITRCHWHYEGSEHHLRMFMIYLAGPKDVTVAVGTKTVPAGHTSATAHWSLTCYRASVARRIGK